VHMGAGEGDELVKSCCENLVCFNCSVIVVWDLNTLLEITNLHDSHSSDGFASAQIMSWPN
jgi:hypothetical protein